MGETLTQRRRVDDEALRGVKSFRPGRTPEQSGLTVRVEEAPANYVPAAAVIRRGQALLGMTGCKGPVGGAVSLV